MGYKPTYITLTKEEAEDILLSKLWKEVESHLDANAKVLKREAYFKESEGIITGTLYVIAEEEIGYPVESSQKIQEKGEMLNE